ncbi:MAG TPA: hypothetical protein VJ756_09940 [Terriglobales bacterium]|nr:hypothetical protein [Terriglobales bacterium]
MDADCLARTLQQYLAEARDAVVIEDSTVCFELARARYTVSAEHGKCLLHLWSDERNTVRRVVDMEEKDGVLRLAVLRFGQSRPFKLEICRDRDRRTATTRQMTRAAYQQRLRRALARHFPEFTLAQITSAVDLERSFGPVYSRGVLRRGGSAFAFLGVNAEETQASVDAALTFGILWLNACRESLTHLQVEGLKLLVPAGRSAVARERMAHLARDAAKWQVYELNEREEELEQLDTGDRGNLATRLVHCCDEAAARERFAESTNRIKSIYAEVEVAVLSPSEVGFRVRGLEFARARVAAEGFRNGQEIVFGTGAAEKLLTEQNAAEFESLVNQLAQVRRAEGPHDHPCWRTHPERWLESLAVQDISSLDDRLAPAPVYSQVPAFSGGDRATIDVLAATREGRLAVVELKADEDIHLPLQGLDYWARVEWHHARGEFSRFGYFPGADLAPGSPLLILVAPAFHIHPATDSLLRFLAPEIEWTLAAIAEHWRDQVRVVFRKRARKPDVDSFTASTGNCQLVLGA